MKLVHCEISGILLNDNTDFTEWIMESPEVFSEYVQELNEQVLGAGEDLSCPKKIKK